MAAADRAIASLITRTPGVYGGQPCLAGTRFPVLQVAADYNAGMSAEEIAAAYEGIELSGVFAALAYYFANKTAVDTELEARRTRAKAGLAEQASTATIRGAPLACANENDAEGRPYGPFARTIASSIQPARCRTPGP
jgi:uncharacterized protein (DUF433 family)